MAQVIITTHSYRVTDISNEGLPLSPVVGLEKIPIPSTLDEALQGLRSIVADIDSFVVSCEMWIESFELPTYVSRAGAMALNLYTREWPDSEESLYYQLNKSLRSADRAVIKPFFPYLRLLLDSMSKLPIYGSDDAHKAVWRGVKGNVSCQYKVGTKIAWWGVSSCTTDLGTAKKFLGNGPKTLFNIHYLVAYDIKQFSLFSESEILLPPARLFEIRNSNELAPDLFLVELQEVKPRAPLIYFPLENKQEEMEKLKEEIQNLKKQLSSTPSTLSTMSTLSTPSTDNTTTTLTMTTTTTTATATSSIVQPSPKQKNFFDFSLGIFKKLTEKSTTNTTKKAKTITKNVTQLRRTQAEYKILMVREWSGVGGQSLTIQLVQNHFMEEYDPPIDDTYRKQLMVNGEFCVVDVRVTAAQEEYSAMRDGWIRSCDGFIVVYSITSRISFDSNRHYMEQIRRVKDADDIPWVLAGNKIDLESERQISTEEGLQFAKEYGMPFYETSALTRVNVEEIFYAVILEVDKLNIRNKIKQ